MSWGREWVLAVGLAVAAWQDLRTRTLSLIWLCLVGAAGLLLALWQAAESGSPSGPVYAVSGLLPGLVLYAIGRATGGKLGEGDAWLFMASGLCLGLVKNLELLWLTGFLSMIFSSVLLALRKANVSTRIPMAPFALTAYLLMLASGMCA